MASTLPLYVGVLGLSAAFTAVLAVYAIRSERVPGRTPFALFMVAVAVWTGAYAAGLLTSGRELRLALESVTWFGRATVHVWFLLFALAYTGYDRVLTKRAVAALLAFPASMVVLVWTNRYHGLVWATEPRVIPFEGLSLVVSAVGPAFWVNVVYAYLLIAAGSALLIRLIVASESLYADQSAFLVVGIVAPFVASAVTVFPPHPIPGLDYTPYGFTITGLTFGYALFRGRLFDLIPATRALGRNTAIAQLEAGILVVDTDRRVLYANDAAGDILDPSPGDALGSRIDSLIDGAHLDFESEDALAEFERDGRVYEIRTSPVTNRHDRPIGYTLVVHDVTTRTARERELSLLDDVNRVIRGVNQALVSATSRDEIEHSLCERVLAADVYQRACVADVPTWHGEADRWVVAGDDEVPASSLLGGETLDPGALAPVSEGLPTVESGDGTWVVVPLVYGRTVYGAVGLYTDRESISDREREVLSELGETVGYAIDAVETRQLLSADEVVAVELEGRDPAAPLVAATQATSGRLEVTALSPRGNGEHVAYVRVEDGDPSTVRDEFETDSTIVRTVRADDQGGLLEWRLTGDSLLGALADEGAHVRQANGGDDAVTYEVEVPSADIARVLVDRVRERFPETDVVAKRECNRPVEQDVLPADVDNDDRFTDRQREVLEIAHHAGYFNWPRDSSAEEVADTLDITSPTLLHHLRTAQKELVDEVFGAESGDRNGVARSESED
jgi:predicted DNA binding protein/PAS domain-containing protein